MACAARMPSSVRVGGMHTSVTTTSGRCSATADSRPSRSPAVATTSMSGSSSSRERTPSRTRRVSSATTRRSGGTSRNLASHESASRCARRRRSRSVMAGSPREDASLLLRLEHAVDDILASHREPDRALTRDPRGDRHDARLAPRVGVDVAGGWSAPGGELERRARRGLGPLPRVRRVRRAVHVRAGGGPARQGVGRAPRAVDRRCRRPGEFPRAPIAQRIGLRSALAFPIGDAHDGDPEGVVELFKDSRLDPDQTLLATLASSATGSARTSPEPAPRPSRATARPSSGRPWSPRSTRWSWWAPTG